jgi:hypothetical protein
VVLSWLSNNAYDDNEDGSASVTDGCLPKIDTERLGQADSISDTMSNIKDRQITDAQPTSVFIRVTLSFYIHCYLA